MIISGTGYRPNKLPNAQTGYQLPNPTYIYVCQQIEKILLSLKPDKIISGGSQGFDQYLSYVGIRLGIPVIFAIPFIGQEKLWTEESQRIYHRLLNKAESVIIVSEGEYSARKMQIRNEFLVDQCDLLLACIRPTEKSGGTFNCVQYAKSQNKQIIMINPDQ